MAAPTTPTNLIRGLLEPCLLSLLEQGPDYGLSLSQRLEASGIGPIPGGTLYPALLRLDRRGLVTTFWRPSSSGPARKYFELTPQGVAELVTRRQEWRRLSAALGAVIEGTGQVTGPLPSTGPLDDAASQSGSAPDTPRDADPAHSSRPEDGPGTGAHGATPGTTARTPEELPADSVSTEARG